MNRFLTMLPNIILGFASRYDLTQLQWWIPAIAMAICTAALYGKLKGA